MHPYFVGLFVVLLASAPASAAKFILYATEGTPGRVDGFCVGNGGALAHKPSVMQDTASATPHRLRLAEFTGQLGGRGTDGTCRKHKVLYVAGVDRVEAFLVEADGGLKRIGSTNPTGSANPADFVVDATKRKLYMPQRAEGRIVAYDLNEDGVPCCSGPPCCGNSAEATCRCTDTVKCEPSTGDCSTPDDIIASYQSKRPAQAALFSSETRTFASPFWESVVLNNGLLYVSHGPERSGGGVDVIKLTADGALPSADSDQDQPAASLKPGEPIFSCLKTMTTTTSTTETTTTLGTDPTTTTTLPLAFSRRLKLGGSRALAIVGDRLFVQQLRSPTKILEFRLDADGSFCPDRVAPLRGAGACCPENLSLDDPKCSKRQLKRCEGPFLCEDQLPSGKSRREPESSATGVLAYQNLLVLRNGKSIIGSSFRGRVDSFALTDGKFQSSRDGGPKVKGPTTSTKRNLASQPGRTWVVSDREGTPTTLYLAGGYLDRIQGYKLKPFTSVFPKSKSGLEPFSETDELKGSFPTDVIVVPIENDCPPPKP